MAPQLSIDDQKQQEVTSKWKMEKGQLVWAKQDLPQRSVTIIILPQQCTAMSAISQKPIAENISQTLDNSCEHDPSMLPTSKQPSASRQVEELNTDLASDPFAAYFNFMDDPHIEATQGQRTQEPTTQVALRRRGRGQDSSNEQKPKESSNRESLGARLRALYTTEHVLNMC